MPFPFVAAATLGAAALGAIGSRNANRANRASARESMDFQERMSSTAYQRAMEDMRLSGLNPMLSSRLGGASTPGGAQSQSQNEMSEAANSAKDAIMMKAQLKNIDAQNANLVAQANLSNSSAKKVDKEAELLDLTKGKEKFHSDLYSRGHDIVKKALSGFSSTAKQFSSDYAKRDEPGRHFFGQIKIRKKDGK